MKRYLQMVIYFFIFWALTGCDPKYKSSPTQLESSVSQNSAPERLGSDSIPKVNDPETLDLTQHQLFLDASGKSGFFREVEGWESPRNRQQTIKNHLKTIHDDFRPLMIDLKNFPRNWVTIRKLHGNFVLYNRCDGIDPRFELRDSAFVFHWIWESEAEAFQKLLVFQDDKISIQVRTYPGKVPDNHAYISLSSTAFEYIYLLHYHNKDYDLKYYVIPVERIEEFDLLVNHCPTQKEIEFNGFEKVP